MSFETNAQATEKHGPISHYYVIVQRDDENLLAPDKIDLDHPIFKHLANSARSARSSSTGGSIYVAARFEADDLPETLTLGDGSVTSYKGKQWYKHWSHMTNLSNDASIGHIF